DPGLDLPPQVKSPKSPVVSSAPDPKAEPSASYSTAATDPSCDPTNACCADPASSAPVSSAPASSAPVSSAPVRHPAPVSPSAPASKAPISPKSDGDVTARDVDSMQRRAAEERRLLEELHTLRQKDPVEFDRR